MIRLGVVGCGRRVTGLLAGAFRDVMPEARVVGAVDPDEVGARSRLPAEDRSSVVFYRNIVDLLRRGRLDGLMIGTRCNLHAPLAVQAARYDVPLFLEKPVATTLRQTLDLERAFAKAKCPVVVSFPLRVSPLCVLARQLIAQQAVGAPEHIQADNYVPYGVTYWESFYRHYEISGGLWLQKATHDLDYMSFLMGSPIVEVAAMANSGRVFGGTERAGLRCSVCRKSSRCLEAPAQRTRNRSTLGFEADHLCVFSVDCGNAATGTNEDCSSAVLRFASGAHGLYSQVFFARRDAARRGATVSGYHGTVKFDWYANRLERIRHHAPFSDVSTPEAGLGHFGGDHELARDFLGLMRGLLKRSRTPIEVGIQSADACLAARQSCRTKRFLKVRQVGF